MGEGIKILASSFFAHFYTIAVVWMWTCVCIGATVKLEQQFCASDHCQIEIL